MMPLDMTTLALAMNVVLIWANVVLIIWLRRGIRRAWVLELLLGGIVARSFMDHHMPTFYAWQRTMGRLEIQVTPIPGPPDVMREGPPA